MIGAADGTIYKSLPKNYARASGGGAAPSRSARRFAR